METSQPRAGRVRPGTGTGPEGWHWEVEGPSEEASGDCSSRDNKRLSDGRRPQRRAGEMGRSQGPEMGQLSPRVRPAGRFWVLCHLPL